jgi:hypothetical protein
MSIATSWGTTPAERAETYPCDALMPPRHLQAWRGIDVAAAPELLFRWLCQLRAAPYSYDWIDNFGRRSPRELTPGLDALAAGQMVMRIFDIVSFDAPEQITIAGNRRARRVFGLLGPLAVTYRVSPTAAGSRLVAKVCAAPGGPIAPLVRLLLPWADLVMMRKQFHTIRSLAERDATLGDAALRS